MPQGWRANGKQRNGRRSRHRHSRTSKSILVTRSSSSSSNNHRQIRCVTSHSSNNLKIHSTHRSNSSNASKTCNANANSTNISSSRPVILNGNRLKFRSNGSGCSFSNSRQSSKGASSNSNKCRALLECRTTRTSIVCSSSQSLSKPYSLKSSSGRRRFIDRSNRCRCKRRIKRSRHRKLPNRTGNVLLRQKRRRQLHNIKVQRSRRKLNRLRCGNRPRLRSRRPSRSSRP
mmetsp:Transcript_27854/g.67478  ORF Transcript_27854/g.67478 Transcript_27854/m.67478 type:complete len:231 (+) Transcript_27854:680-1372(+)